MLKLIRLFTFLLLSLEMSTGWCEGVFTTPDPNAGYTEIIKKSQDSSPVQNTDYLKNSIKEKVALNSGTSSTNQESTATGNSVVIGEGSTVNGDVIVNIEVTGDTYVSGQ